MSDASAARARAQARKAKLLRWGLNLYPPYLGAGVRVKHIRADFRQATVSMGLNRLNRNYVGTHFGGSLYSMVDPFFMLLLLESLGSDYFVWDKAAHIDFVSPGKGRVHAHFAISDALLAEIAERTAGGDKYLPELCVDVLGDDGELVARVHKTLYVRRKPKARTAQESA